MKKTILLTFFLLNTIDLANAFYLNPSTGRGFNKNEINIHIASTDCSAAGFSTQTYKDLIEDAVEDYWNSVPTSAIKLHVKSIGNIDIAGDTFSTAINKVPTNSILAGCNASADGFGNGGDPSTTLGAAVMSCSGSSCQSVLILNANADSQLPNMSRSQLRAVIAHEIGHAIGLGHSKFQESLMYYSASGKYQKWLGIDDIDGVNYLYPHEKKDPLGLAGTCGTIDIDRDGPNSNFIFTLIFGFLLAFLLSSRRPSLKE